MGWCSGTEIFDVVASAVLDKNEKSEKEILMRVIDLLENMDWDCQDESEFWEHPIVREIFKERNPDWFKDNE